MGYTSWRIGRRIIDRGQEIEKGGYGQEGGEGFSDEVVLAIDERKE